MKAVFFVGEGKSIEVEGKSFQVPDDIPEIVWDLVLRLSMERDHYREEAGYGQ